MAGEWLCEAEAGGVVGLRSTLVMGCFVVLPFAMTLLRELNEVATLPSQEFDTMDAMWQATLAVTALSASVAPIFCRWRSL